MDMEISLFDFLIEAELQNYYEPITNDLKIWKTSQLKYVSDEDLTLLGMSRPEQRRLKKFYSKYYSQNYLSRIKRLLGPGKKDENCTSLGSLSEERAQELQSEALPDTVVKGPYRHIIPIENISIHKELGAGEFGVVKQGVWTNDSRRIQVAIKCLSRERMSTDSEGFLIEAEIMHSIDHKSIVPLYGVVLTPDALMMVTELAPLRSLLECLKEVSLRSSFPVLTLCEFALQICEGMSYLENKRLIHRDLAARNVLVFSKNKVKISDFGLSRALGVGKDYYQTNFNVNLKLPIAWCAPECISYLRFTSASDVWAYAVTLWEMFSYGFQPWAAFSGHQILVAIDAPNYQRLEQPECCPREYFALMQKCWDHEPTNRPKFSEIIYILPDCKPEQVQTISASEYDPNVKRSDQLICKGGDIITVLDKGSHPSATQWKGILNNGTTGLFNPQNVVSYLGTSLPSNQNAFIRSSSEGAGTSIRNSLIRDKESSTKRRLRSDMISAPQGVKHTGHVGLDGAFFGDVSFLEINNLPRQVVTPYKPSEDLEQIPLINPNSPSHLTGGNNTPLNSLSHPILLRETNPHHQIGKAEARKFIQGTEDKTAHGRHTGNFKLDSVPHLSKVKWPGSKDSTDSNHSTKSKNDDFYCNNDCDGDIDPETPHEYQEISDDDQKPSDFRQSLLDEMESMFRSMGGLNSRAVSSNHQDHEVINQRNEIVELNAKLNDTATLSKKKQAISSVKLISAHDQKMLDTAIALANELTANSMTDLVHNEPPKTPTTPSEKSKFHFRFPLTSGHSHTTNTLKSGDSKGADSHGNKMDKRSFSQEAQSVPDIQKLQCSLQSLSSIASNDIDSLSQNILRLPLWDKASAEFCFAKSRELLTKPLNITSYSDLSEVSSFGYDVSSLQGTLTSLNKESYYDDNIMHGFNDQVTCKSKNKSKCIIYNSDENTNSDNDTLTKKSSKNTKANRFSNGKKKSDREEIVQNSLSALDSSTLKRDKKSNLSSLRDHSVFKTSDKEYNSKSSSFDLLETIDRSLSKVGIFSSNKKRGSPLSPQFNTKNASMTPKSVKSPNASFFLFPNINDTVGPDFEGTNSNSGYEHDLNVYSPRSLQNGELFQDTAYKSMQQYNDYQGLRKSGSFTRKKSGIDRVQQNNNISKKNGKPDSNTFYESNSIYVQQIDGKKYVVAAPKNYGFDNKMVFNSGLHNSNSSIHSYQVQKSTFNQKNDYYATRPRALSFSERNAPPHSAKSNFPMQKVLSSKSIKARNLRRQSYNPGVYDLDTSSSDSEAAIDYSISHSECDIRLIMNKTSTQSSKHVRQLSCRRSSQKSSSNKISSKLSTSNSSIRSVPQNFVTATGNGHPSSDFNPSRNSKSRTGNFVSYDQANIGFMYRNQPNVSSQGRTPIKDSQYRLDSREFAEGLLRMKPKPVLGNHLHPGYGIEASNFDVSKLTGKSPPPSQNFLNNSCAGSPTLRSNISNGRSGTSTPCSFNWPETISASAVNVNFTPSLSKDWYSVDRKTLDRINVEATSSSSSDCSNDSLTEYPEFKMDYSIGFPPSPAP